MEINKVSEETKNAISRKSAMTLPNNPSERGYSADTIRKRFFQPIIDTTNSAIAEIDRVVEEANNSIKKVREELENYINNSSIKEPYKLKLGDNWVLNEETGMYEVYIQKEEHGIEKYEELGVDMYIFDGENQEYIQVNQFTVSTDATVRCYHENKSDGYVSIYIKREGFILSNIKVEADNVKGLSEVAKSGNYEDLIDKPNIDLMNSNYEDIIKIINGDQPVGKAKALAENADVPHANNCNYAQEADIAKNVKEVINGKDTELNIVQTFAKQNGTYKDMSVGNATNATNDSEGKKISDTYLKKDSTEYLKSSDFQKDTNSIYDIKVKKATNADIAKQATQDGKGAEISTTYATKEEFKKTYANQNGHYGSLIAGSASYMRFKKITFSADIYAEGEDKTGITLTGYGIIAIDFKDMKTKYWIGTLQGTRSGEDNNYNNISYIKLTNIKVKDLDNVISIKNVKIINGGIFMHKESDDTNSETGIFYDIESNKNNKNECIYYAEDSGRDYAFDENSYIMITNMIMQLNE